MVHFTFLFRLLSQSAPCRVYQYVWSVHNHCAALSIPWRGQHGMNCAVNINKKKACKIAVQLFQVLSNIIECLFSTLESCHFAALFPKMLIGAKVQFLPAMLICISALHLYVYIYPLYACTHHTSECSNTVSISVVLTPNTSEHTLFPSFPQLHVPDPELQPPQPKRPAYNVSCTYILVN